KKTPRFPRNPSAFDLSAITMVVFHLNTLNHAGGTSAGVIHLNLLAGAERSGYDFARAVNDACRRPKSEAHRTLTLTFYDNSFAGRVRVHGPGFICGRFGGFRRGRS